jgi:hypothetical protein
LKQIISYIAFILVFQPRMFPQNVLFDVDTNKSTAPFSQAKFVPDISLIADFSLVTRNISEEKYVETAVPGWTSRTESARKGFSLNYGELAISAAVDKYFDLFTVFHLRKDAFEIEEAYFKTRVLPLGFQLKAGKFLSNFGRINSQHSHFWNFDDPPLVNAVFFGKEGLNEEGVQLNWLAPLPFYLQLGVEALTGTNEFSFGSAPVAELPDPLYPQLWVGYAKASMDAGKWVALGGLSVAAGKTRIAPGPDMENPNAIAGNMAITGVDLLVKYLIDSYRFLSLQCEFISRHFTGDEFGQGLMASLVNRQSGFYSELCWKFDRRLRISTRFDALLKNHMNLDGSRNELPSNLNRWTLACDFIPSEFSRLRVQYCSDHSRFLQTDRLPVNEFNLGINLAIGAHGAHGL